jgi:hypothetical protein
MAPQDFHEKYTSIDFENIPGYPNEFDVDERWLEDYPKFEGFVIIHIVEFLEYLLEKNHNMRTNK